MTDADLKLAIILTVWGAGIVLASYQLTSLALNGGHVVRKGPNLLAFDPQTDAVGFHADRIVLGGSAILVVTLAYAALSAPRIVAGVQGALVGSEASILGARYDIGADYWFIYGSDRPLVGLHPQERCADPADVQPVLRRAAKEAV